jgi:predicted nucleic acid-binding protein
MSADPFSAEQPASAELKNVFVDTNILVYAYDRTAGEKHKRARTLLENLWANSRGCISLQVLQEFYVVITQKVPDPLDPESAAAILRDLAFWRIHAPVAEDVLGAIELQQRHRVSFWDAMILWSAVQLGCAEVWSEDLSHGQAYDGVRVINPLTAA